MSDNDYAANIPPTESVNPHHLRILIGGASGLIGSHARDYLRGAGHEVHVLVRRNADPSKNEICWSPGQGKLDAGLLSELDAVVHLSGENIATRWTREKKRRIRDSRVNSTRLLAEALARTPVKPKVLVCASAIGYYGNRGNEMLAEDAAAGTGFLAEVCREWEAAAEPARAAGIRVVNLRTGVVITAEGGALTKMLTPFRMGVGGVVGSGDQWMSWISLADLLRVIEFVIHRDDLAGPVNAVAPEPVTNREMTKALGAMLHRPTMVPMPATAVRIGFGQMGEETLLASTRVVPKRLADAGFEFQHPHLADALQHELQFA